MDKSRMIEVFGLWISLNSLFALIITVASIWFICWFCTRNLSVDNPSKPQLLMEKMIEFVHNVVGGALHEPHTQMYQLLGLTLLLFVFVSNMLGLPLLLEISDYSYWRSPTADPIVCLSLALLVILLSHYLGIDKQGFKHYLVNSYLKPSPAMLPLKLVEEFTNTLTLALRLYGNIFAGEVLLKLIAQLALSVGPVTWALAIPLQMVWQGFSIFIGAIQAYIFVTLTMVYLSHKVEVEEV